MENAVSLRKIFHKKAASASGRSFSENGIFHAENKGKPQAAIPPVENAVSLRKIFHKKVARIGGRSFSENGDFPRGERGKAAKRQSLRVGNAVCLRKIFHKKSSQRKRA